MQTWEEFLKENYELTEAQFKEMEISKKYIGATKIIKAEYEEYVKHFIGW